jgi:plastocyanin
MLSRVSRGLISTGLIVAALGVSNVSAQTPLAVVATDFKFDKGAYTAAAGPVTFNLANQGARPHDIAIGTGTNAIFQVVAGDANVAGGQSASGTFTFQPGTYEMWCPVGNHRAQGMVATFTVTAAAGAAAAPAAAAPAAAAAAPAAATLPRTGEPVTLLGGLLAGSGALLAVAGAYLRRRSS